MYWALKKVFEQKAISCITNQEVSKHKKECNKKENLEMTGYKTERKYRPCHVTWGTYVQTHTYCKPFTGIFIGQMCGKAEMFVSSSVSLTCE